MDAKGKELLGIRYYGCSIDDLYNHVRPHSSLKDLTPVEFKKRYHSTNPGAILKL
jgi:hypothetical protein